MAWEQGLAIYAAGLSTALAWLQYRKARRTIHLTAMPAVNPKPDMPGMWVRVSLQNHGFEPVRIERAILDRKIERPDLGVWGWRGLVEYHRWYRSWWYSSTALPSACKVDQEFPADVQPGRSTAIWLPCDMLKEAEKEAVGGILRVSVQDALDRTFRSPILPVL